MQNFSRIVRRMHENNVAFAQREAAKHYGRAVHFRQTFGLGDNDAFNINYNAKIAAAYAETARKTLFDLLDGKL